MYPFFSAHLPGFFPAVQREGIRIGIFSYPSHRCLQHIIYEESEEQYMNRKTCKRVTAMLLAAVLTAGAVLPGGYAYAESTTLPGVTETHEPDSGGTEGTRSGRTT